MAGDDVAELRTAGYTEGEIVELIANASLNMFAYYMILVESQPQTPTSHHRLPRLTHALQNEN